MKKDLGLNIKTYKPHQTYSRFKYTVFKDSLKF